MNIKDLMNMKKARLLGAIVGSIFFFFSVSIPVSAATYSITFYEKLSGPVDNLFNTDHYVVSGTGSFEINDEAVTADNLVLFSDSSNFLSFDVTITSTIGSAQFTLGIDDFPPHGDGTGTGAETHEQGILFDASGQPLRFDNPATTFGNTAQICDPTCDTPVTSKAGLVLLDDNGFDTVFLNDGTLTTLNIATLNGDAFTALNGAWGFSPLGSISNTFPPSYYLIETVPIPAAVWLFGSGLIGLIGIARRKS